MSIEALLTSLKESIDRNTAALEKAAGATTSASAGETKTTGKGRTTAETKKTDEPKVTQEQVNAALIKIKDAFGMPEAKTVIKEFGLVDKMADIKPAQFKAVLEGAIAKFDELTAAAEGGDDKGDDL